MGCTSSKNGHEVHQPGDLPRKLQTEEIHVKHVTTPEEQDHVIVKPSKSVSPLGSSSKDPQFHSLLKDSDLRASDGIQTAPTNVPISPRQNTVVGELSARSKTATEGIFQPIVAPAPETLTTSNNPASKSPQTSPRGLPVVPILRAHSTKLTTAKSYYGALKSSRISPRLGYNMHRTEDQIVDALVSKELAMQIADAQLTTTAKRARRGEIAGEVSVQDTVSSLLEAIQQNAVTSPKNTDWQSFAKELKRFPKTEEEKLFIIEALGRNFMFTGMSFDEKKLVCEAMERKVVSAGQVLISQGNVGDQCYVVHSGLLEVFVNDQQDVELDAGSLIGELALMYGVASESTVIAKTPAVMWSLDRQTFRSIVLAATVKQYEDAKRFLSGVALLTSLNSTQIAKLAEAAQKVTFPAGTRIIQQGDSGQVFYMIMKGHAQVVKREENDDDADDDDDEDEDEEEHDVVTIVSRQSIGLGNEPSNLFTPKQGSFALRKMSKSSKKKRLTSDTPSGHAGRSRNSAQSVSTAPSDSNPQEGFLLKDEMALICLSVGSWFGEQALLHDQPRAASVVALTEVTCLALSRDQFFALLGPLQDILNSQHQQRQDVERTVRALYHHPSATHVNSDPDLQKVIGYITSRYGGKSQEDLHSLSSSSPRPFTRNFTFTEEQMKISALPEADATPTPVGLQPDAAVTEESMPTLDNNRINTSDNTFGGVKSGAGALPSPPAMSPENAPEKPVSTSTHTNPPIVVNKLALPPQTELTAAIEASKAAAAILQPSMITTTAGSSPDLSTSTRSGLPSIAEENNSSAGSFMNKTPHGKKLSFVGKKASLTTPPVIPNRHVPPLLPTAATSTTTTKDATTPVGVDNVITSSSGRVNAGAGKEEPAAKRALSHLSSASLKSLRPDISLSDLELLAVLGEGAFGLVRLVRHKGTGEVYALKQMQKARIVATNQQRNVMNEKRILSKLRHPYIIEFVKTFKDKDCLFLLSEYCPGGDLFGALLRVGGVLTVTDATFYAAIVTLVLEYVHSMNVLYRDLKPENLLLDREGFLKVCDFGFAKVVTDRTYTLCGTPEYLAPELVQGRGHGKGVDWWALGILIYEMLAGFSPFADHEANEQVTIYKNILRGNLKFPSSFRDVNAKDIIKRLLTASSSARLGCLKGGAADVKKHKFFEKMDWDSLYKKTITPPIKPVVKSMTDTSNFDEFAADTRIQRYVDNGEAWDADF